jgi:hypothetical protein
MLSTIRPLTRQKQYMHYQHYYLNNSKLTTLIQQARFYLFQKFKDIKNEDNAPSLTTTQSFQIPFDNENVSADNEVKFETEVFKNKVDKNITAKFSPNNLNKNITDVLRGDDQHIISSYKYDL